MITNARKMKKTVEGNCTYIKIQMFFTTNVQRMKLDILFFCMNQKKPVKLVYSIHRICIIIFISNVIYELDYGNGLLLFLVVYMARNKSMWLVLSLDHCSLLLFSWSSGFSIHSAHFDSIFPPSAQFLMQPQKSLFFFFHSFRWSFRVVHRKWVFLPL